MEHKKHNSNPFTNCTFKIETAIKKGYLKKGKWGDIAEVRTGELVETQFITRKKVDAEEFIKIFSKYTSCMWGINAPGLKVFLLLLKNIQEDKDKDTVFLDQITCHIWNEEMPSKTISKATFRRGKHNLLDCKIIAQTLRNNEFYINPRVIFNGDRLSITTIYEQN